MNVGSLHSSRRPSGRRALGILASVWMIASCHQIDTTRVAPPKATLGDDIYGVFCDRVGASSFTEDLSGASFHAVCHYDDQGRYADAVDESALPPPSNDAQTRARKLSVGKIEAMARHRSDFIQAINAAFPSGEIPDVVKGGDAKIDLHEALLDFAQKLTPLYESNPIDAKADPLFPNTTRTLARLFDALLESQPAREAMQRMGSRKGYRPLQIALGAIRPALTTPNLRALTTSALDVLGPGGVAAPELQQLLKISKRELNTSTPVIAKLGAYKVDPNTLQPSRPRSTLEVLASVMLTQDDAFAEGKNLAPSYIAARDGRGFVMTSLASPFADKDGDGLADVDGFGRFLDPSGSPASVPPPFWIAGVAGEVDGFGRPSGAVPLYQYIDTQRSALGAVARHLVPLIDGTMIGSGPDAWKDEHETLMYAVGGAYTLFGPRAEAVYDYETETINAAGVSCPSCVPYLRFKGEESPLPDLVHAVGQVLADEESDAILASLLDLVENHEQTVARLLGAALKIREVALQHDAKAQKGEEPFAALPYQTPIWDEMGEVVHKILQRPGLVKRLLGAMADEALVTTHSTSKHMGDTVASFVENRDEIGYNKNDLNGPRINYTDGFPSTQEPHNKVDRKKPLVDENRSALQRSLQLIHDANGGPACNKDGAKVKAKVGPLSLSWPIIGSYKQCELFEFENLATFYLDSILPLDHPKRSELKVNDSALNGIMDFFSGVGVSADGIFETSSGIKGLTLHPDPSALNMLVFFGASQSAYASMPITDDLFNKGSQTDAFISNLIQPVSQASCPPNGIGVPVCSSAEGTLRESGPNTIFLWEKLGFYDYLRPLVKAFADTKCDKAGDPPDCGERLMVELVEVLNRHWPGKDHGDECAKTGTAATNPRYCSEAGINNYEPILAEAFRGDIIPALHEFATVATELSKITVKRGPKAGQTMTGTDVLEKVTRILFDKAYAQKVGMVDRKGSPSAKWVDGTAQSQVTGFTLFADALHGLDTRWDKACDTVAAQDQEACKLDVEQRKGQWKRARSQLVDEFLAVDGTGTGAKFHNAAIPKFLSATLRVAREQLNANCPDREKGAPCTWAKKELGKKFETTLSGPLFAALLDVQEKIRQNEPARRELEKTLAWVLGAEKGAEGNLPAALSSFGDLLQVLQDDGNMSPIMNAIATVASPEGDEDGEGALDATLKVLKVLNGDEYDRYHVLDYVLPNLVKPIGEGRPSPIEVFMDTIADVNRVDAATDAPFDVVDYETIMGTMNDFLTGKTRGLEQFYTIVQSRPRQ